MTTLWGPHVWNFLHIFCEKIKNEEFLSKKDKIYSVIHSICVNLPCPECSEDATNLLNSFSLQNNVKNKTDLKMYLYHFHNKINAKLNKDKYNLESLERYSTGNINIAFNNYLLALEQNNKPNEKLLLHRFSLSKCIKNIKKFMESNIDIFD